MKKLFLLPLMAIGLALVPAKQADAQVSIGVGGVGVGFGYPTYGYSYYGHPGITVITRAAITRTMVGRPTAAIDITSITSVIITATKKQT
jgi:hypothetical protein